MSGMSFLDTTSDSGPGSSYDITLYEDLDEELRHRENKKVPEWAKNRKFIIIFNCFKYNTYKKNLIIF
jgi:hypothetical protein